LSALKTAWVENPSIAVQFVRRFHSLTLLSSLRFLLLSFPEKVLNNCEALEMILGASLAGDVKLQLKVSSLNFPCRYHVDSFSTFSTGAV
jgi:phosphatidylinositol 4-kinase A